MPLMKYFGFVGSGLFLLLIGIGWFFQQPVPEPIRNDIERPTIRISSVEQLPERVVIDTSLPTIVPPSGENFDPPPITMSTAQQLQDTFAGINVSSNPSVPKGVGDGIKTKPFAKREATKKVVPHRAGPPLNIAPAPTHFVQAAPPDTRMSFLETLKERLEHTLFKFN